MDGRQTHSYRITILFVTYNHVIKKYILKAEWSQEEKYLYNSKSKVALPLNIVFI